MNSRRHALALARRFRTCPPPALTGLPQMHPQIEAHRRRCPLCAEPDSGVGWQSMADRIVGTTKRVCRRPEPVQPGQLVAVKPDLACWREDLFYSPPLVLVLAVCETPPGAVQVAQTYHDLLLAAPGDLIIDPPPAHAPLPFFIQCWNRYTLRAEDLADPLAVLSQKVVRAAIVLGSDPGATPEWAPLPVPLDGENDPRLAFRRMEVEVGFVFASAAAEALMAGNEPFLAPVGEVKAALQHLIAGAQWRSGADSSAQILATVELPDDFYPLAAAGEDVRVFGRRFDLVDGRPARIFTFSPRLDRIEPLSESVSGASGCIQDFHDRQDRSRLLAALVRPGQPPVPCPSVDWAPRTGFFYVEIPEADLLQARLEITLLVEAMDA